MATVRSLAASSGQIALVQPMPHILSGWWTRTIGHVSLLGATILVLLGIGITVVAGPLYAYAERSAIDLQDGAVYVSAVLPPGIR